MMYGGDWSRFAEGDSLCPFKMAPATVSTRAAVARTNDLPLLTTDVTTFMLNRSTHKKIICAFGMEAIGDIHRLSIVIWGSIHQR